jgi:aromatic-L-amino-acid decarboxylase
MDWAARLLGLSPAFYNSSGIGGGAIQVRSEVSLSDSYEFKFLI